MKPPRAMLAEISPAADFVTCRQVGSLPIYRQAHQFLPY
jgi:hypothetical protein